MMWIEMAKDINLRPINYKLGECLSSPKYKNNGLTWAYWENMLKVKRNDMIFHLSLDTRCFLGYSQAEEDGFEIDVDLYGKKIDSYKVQLKNFVLFDKPIYLNDIFNHNSSNLKEYLDNNKKLSKDNKETLFYVLHNQKLECQNGAYLSELSPELAELIFIKYFLEDKMVTPNVDKQVPTDSKFKPVLVRIGHEKFSKNVKNNFYNECAFPNCNINEKSFLVGSHIARWADEIDIRGDTSNGICLCVFHDKAFENGYFTIDQDMCIVVNQTKIRNYIFLKDTLEKFHKQKIKKSIISLSKKALMQHWKRIKFEP